MGEERSAPRHAANSFFAFLRNLSLPPRFEPTPIATKTGRGRRARSVFVVGVFRAFERLSLAEGQLFVVIHAFGRRVFRLAGGDVFILAIAVEDVRIGELVALRPARGVEHDGRRRLRGSVLLVGAALRAVNGRLPQVVELRPALEAVVFVSEIRQFASCKTGRNIASLDFQGQRAGGPYTWGPYGVDFRPAPETAPRAVSYTHLTLPTKRI